MIHFLDCDGVMKLYTPEGEDARFDWRAVKGVKLLRAKGYTPAIASGKSVPYLADLVQKSGLTGLYLIGENGHVVVDPTGKRLYVAPQDGFDELRRGFERQLTDHGNGWKHLRRNGVEGYVGKEPKEATTTYLLRSEKPQDFLRYALDIIESLVEGGPFEIHSSVTRYGAYIDIIRKGVNKGTGAQIPLNDLNVKPEEAWATGDSPNDIPLINLVGHPRAVGNATPEFKTCVIDRGGFVAKGEVGAGVLEIAQHEKALLS